MSTRSRAASGSTSGSCSMTPDADMPDVDELLKQYIEDHRAGGEADPRGYLAQVEGTDRSELAALIDAYLVRSPGQPWDEGAYTGSPAERVVESLRESLAGSS